ncbi:MAG: hypothetical protein Q8O19_01915, partial [Rectinemataceae bacterium]|nr:hypothetical protein [Rectinemataceae bacterium]
HSYESRENINETHMPEELKNITGSVMERIHQDKIKMRPRVYFVIGSLLTFIGLVLSILTSVFLIGLMRFSLRAHGPMGEYRLEELLSRFSWWGPICALLGLVIGIWLLRRYDFSYKINFKVMVAGFIAAIIVAGWVLDMTGLNDVLLRRGPTRGMMREYFQENSTQPGQGGSGWKNNQQRPMNNR